jgi:hypothetical protein
MYMYNPATESDIELPSNSQKKKNRNASKKERNIKIKKTPAHVRQADSVPAEKIVDPPERLPHGFRERHRHRHGVLAARENQRRPESAARERMNDARCAGRRAGVRDNGGLFIVISACLEPPGATPHAGLGEATPPIADVGSAGGSRQTHTALMVGRRSLRDWRTTRRDSRAGSKHRGPCRKQHTAHRMNSTMRWGLVECALSLCGYANPSNSVKKKESSN